MRPMVLQTIKVLVSFAASVALVWLLLLHALRAGVRNRCFWIDDGICAISIFMQPLVIMSVLEKRQLASSCVINL